jgi:hypothetical protein
VSISLQRCPVEEPDHWQRRLLPARRERPRRRRPAEKRDELAPFQLIELHAVATTRAGLQGIEPAAISQRVSERLYNLLAVGEAADV